MYPNAGIALEAELIRLGEIEERFVEVRRASLRALQGAGFDLGDVRGRRGLVTLRLWDEIRKEGSKAGG